MIRHGAFLSTDPTQEMSLIQPSKKARVDKVGGSYLLLIRVSRNIKVKAGRLAEETFPKGHYLYCGNAASGVEARVRRHLRKSDKALHWHVDYLLENPDAAIVAAWGFFCGDVGECDLVAAVEKKLEGRALQKGFGATDCRSGCSAHLLYVGAVPKISLLPFVGRKKLFSRG